MRYFYLVVVSLLFLSAVANTCMCLFVCLCVRAGFFFIYFVLASIFTILNFKFTASVTAPRWTTKYGHATIYGHLAEAGWPAGQTTDWWILTSLSKTVLCRLMASLLGLGLNCVCTNVRYRTNTYTQNKHKCHIFTDLFFTRPNATFCRDCVCAVFFHSTRFMLRRQLRYRLSSRRRRGFIQSIFNRYLCMIWSERYRKMKWTCATLLRTRKHASEWTIHKLFISFIKVSDYMSVT